MRKNILTLVAVVAMVFGLQAQDYNKWSLDADFGVNKPGKYMTKGYSTEVVNLFHGGLSFRYMINSKFGLKFGMDYDGFKNAKDKPEFNSRLYRPNAQFVANLGRLVGMEDMSNRISVLAHLGGGVGILSSDFLTRHSGTDKLLFGTMGITPQIKLAERVALFMDASMFLNMMGNRTFDTRSKLAVKGFDGYAFTASIGLNIYLGGNEKHVDWMIAAVEAQEQENLLQDQINKIKEDVATLKTNADDAQNNITDNETEINKLRGDLANNNNKPQQVMTSGDVVKEFVEKGLVNVHFDFNDAKPNKSALWMIGLVARYMEEHSSATVTLNGYADEVGEVNYNNTLSQTRADNVRQLLIDAGIDGSRINAVGKGVETDKSHDLVRRVLVVLDK